MKEKTLILFCMNFVFIYFCLQPCLSQTFNQFDLFYFILIILNLILIILNLIDYFSSFNTPQNNT